MYYKISYNVVDSYNIIFIFDSIFLVTQIQNKKIEILDMGISKKFEIAKY